MFVYRGILLDNVRIVHCVLYIFGTYICCKIFCWLMHCVWYILCLIYERWWDILCLIGEKVHRGRSTSFQGWQEVALGGDNAYDGTSLPYIWHVDRVMLAPGEWSVAITWQLVAPRHIAWLMIPPGHICHQAIWHMIHFMMVPGHIAWQYKKTITFNWIKAKKWKNCHVLKATCDNFSRGWSGC